MKENANSNGYTYAKVITNKNEYVRASAKSVVNTNAYTHKQMK